MKLDSIRLTFNTRVRQLRVLMNMKQADLAFDADLARAYISEFESGARYVSLLTTCKLSTRFTIIMDVNLSIVTTSFYFALTLSLFLF